MALDGVTLSNIIYELKNLLIGGRIDKIYQPENDEIIMNIRNNSNNYKLLLTSNANHARVHLTQIQKENPITAPVFCMMLRKHISGGKIISIEQPNFERILNINIDAINEMGDSVTKKLVIEIMGKHSNIILLNENNIILDSIKHISHDTSSVREVLPGKNYILPPSQGKLNILELDYNSFVDIIASKKGLKIQNILFQSYSGISPILASEICYRSNTDADLYSEQMNLQEIQNLFKAFNNLKLIIAENKFSPEIIIDTKNKKIIDFSPIEMTQFNCYDKQKFDSVSKLLEIFYNEKDKSSRIKQKSHDLHKLLMSNIDRCIKKREIQNKTLKDIESRDKWKIAGELITANIYSIQKGMTNFETQNFYEQDMPNIKLKLDPELSPVENAQKYFNKYNKAKRTFNALQEQIKQNDDELKYLEAILSSLDNSSDESNILELHSELFEQGYIKKRKTKKGQKLKKTKPMHFISSQDYDIYVGKNNKQNDELTLHFATSNDIWLHTKDIPGSHVIIKTKGYEIPEETIIEGACLAAFYSKGRNSSNVPVDYTLKKYVKKPNGAKPGMVIYEDNKTLFVTPDEKIINSIKEIK